MTTKRIYSLLIFYLFTVVACQANDFSRHAGNDNVEAESLEITPPPPTASMSSATPTHPIPITPTPSATATQQVTPTPQPLNLRVYESAYKIFDFVWFAGKLWTTTENGVFAWDVDTGDSVSYTTEQGLPDNFATRLTICPLPDPTLMVATQGGWAIFNPELDSWGDIQPVRDRMNKLDASLFGNGLPDMRILACDAAMNWLLFGNKTLYRLDMGSGEIDVPSSPNMPLAFIDEVAVVGEDIWMVSQLGGAVVIHENEIFPIKPTDYALTAAIQVAPAPDGVVWIGSPAGLVRWQNGEAELWLGKTTSASGPFIPYVSQDGKLWVDLNQTNVCQLNLKTKECDLLLTPEDGLPSDTITGFTEDDVGNLYIRTAGNHFARWGN